jgi:hypothetical protein
MIFSPALLPTKTESDTPIPVTSKPPDHETSLQQYPLPLSFVPLEHYRQENQAQVLGGSLGSLDADDVDWDNWYITGNL